MPSDPVMRNSLISWLFRRAHTFLMADLACSARRCGRRRVGFSVWCRLHTDRILAGERTEGWR